MSNDKPTPSSTPSRDIAEWIRSLGYGNAEGPHALAADEIEWLRAQRTELRANVEMFMGLVQQVIDADPVHDTNIAGDHEVEDCWLCRAKHLIEYVGGGEDE